MGNTIILLNASSKQSVNVCDGPCKNANFKHSLNECDGSCEHFNSVLCVNECEYDYVSSINRLKPTDVICKPCNITITSVCRAV